MSDFVYRGLLYEIGEKLSQDLGQSLMVSGLKGEANDITDAHLLLERLNEKGRLKIDKLGDLKGILAALKELSLFDKLEKFEKKRREYHDLLAKVSNALDSDEPNHLEQLKRSYERETSSQLNESISDIGTLFEKLQEHEILEFHRLDFLKKILTEIEREDLVKEIEEYEERRNKNDATERMIGK